MTTIEASEPETGDPPTGHHATAGVAAPVGGEAPILAVMSSMRAMRRLRPDPVPDELLRRLVEAATWAGTGSFLQRYSFVIVTDREQIARLAAIWRAVEQFYLATSSSVPEGTTPEQYARLIDAVEYQAQHFEETPAVIVPCYDFGPVPNQVRRRMLRSPNAFRRLGARRTLAMLRNQFAFSGRSEAASIYPAVQNLLLTARTMGLAANLTTWHLLAEGEVKRALGIPRKVQTFGIIPIGWPIGSFGPVRRRPVDEVIHRNRW
jgi:nitroreductase